MYKLNFSQIRAFHALAETGSVTAAAEKLFLTQPAVTLQLKALQDYYGITLLYKQGRSIELAPAGLELHALTKRLFSIVRETDEFLTSMDNLEQGHLTIGADSPFHVMKLMADFKKNYEGISISIALGNTEEVFQNILHCHSDVAVIASYIDEGRISKIPFCASPLVLIVSKQHEWSSRSSITIEELQDIPMIQREEGSATRACFERALQKVNVQPYFFLQIDTREAVREAVAQDMGIGIVPKSEIGSDSRLHSIPISNGNVILEQFIIFLTERKNSRIITAFVELLSKSTET